MPQNEDFSIQVLVGGSPIPEYETDGRYYVECNLATPVTYRQSITEVVNGEEETQSVPVTPYQLCLCSRASTPEPCYFRILVDGVKVKGLSISRGQARIVKGFRDGACIREFLFSMPRFAKDTGDRLTDERKEKVSSIEVQCWNATLRKTKFGLKRNYLEFQQANKKDSLAVTNGDYTMATSKAGKVICSRSLYRSVDNWKLVSQRSSIAITYHMAHTLVGLGLELRPFQFHPDVLKAGSIIKLKRPSPGGSALSREGPAAKLAKVKDGTRDAGAAGDDVTGAARDDVDAIVLVAEGAAVDERPPPTVVDLTDDGDDDSPEPAPSVPDSPGGRPSVKVEVKVERAPRSVPVTGSSSVVVGGLTSASSLVTGSDVEAGSLPTISNVVASGYKQVTESGPAVESTLVTENDSAPANDAVIGISVEAESGLPTKISPVPEIILASGRSHSSLKMERIASTEKASETGDIACSRSPQQDNVEITYSAEDILAAARETAGAEAMSSNVSVKQDAVPGSSPVIGTISLNTPTKAERLDAGDVGCQMEVGPIPADIHLTSQITEEGPASGDDTSSPVAAAEKASLANMKTEFKGLY